MPTEWNNARLDDLHRWIQETAKRVDNIGMIIAGHDLQLIEIQKDRANRREHRWALLLVILTIIIGQSVNVALQTIHSVKPPTVQVRIVK